jgi:hypothetical protein
MQATRDPWERPSEAARPAGPGRAERGHGLRKKAGLLFLVLLALLLAATPAVASLPQLPDLNPQPSAIERALERLEEVRPQAEVPEPRVHGPPAAAASPFSLWAEPPTGYGELFPRGEARAFARLPVEASLLEPSVELEVAPGELASLPETRVRAFSLFAPGSHPAPNRVSDGSATGFGLGLAPERVGRATTNIYAFVGWQPSMWTDPLGLYQRDFHQGMTEFLAREAGFSPLFAKIVGMGAYRPDTDERDPLTSGGNLLVNFLLPRRAQHAAASTLRQWHFPLTCPDGLEGLPGTCVVQPGSPEAWREVRLGIEEGDLRRFSEGLHPLQDSYSHQGRPAWHYWDIRAGVFAGYGHPRDRGGPWRSHADHPPEYPEIAIEAIEATLEALLLWRIERQGLSELDAAAIRARFEREVKPAVEEWIRLPSRSEREAWLRERGILLDD